MIDQLLSLHFAALELNFSSCVPFFVFINEFFKVLKGFFFLFLVVNALSSSRKLKIKSKFRISLGLFSKFLKARQKNQSGDCCCYVTDMKSYHSVVVLLLVSSSESLLYHIKITTYSSTCFAALTQ